MTSLKPFLAPLVSTLFVGSVLAQGDFFFSFTEGGSNSDQVADFEVGDTGSLWIYWTTNGPADSDLDTGGFIDVINSTNGVIEFTAAQTFDFEITVMGTPFDNRLLDADGSGGYAGDPWGSVSADLIDEMAAFTTTGGVGILESNNGSGPFLDQGYNFDNDGFLWGRVDFDVVGSGSTQVMGAVGEGLLINNDMLVNAGFTTATINVTGIPEPATTCLFCLGWTGVAMRRRR